MSFLLITAVWSQMARVDTDANVPNQQGVTPNDQPKTLHVELRGERGFQLVWKQGSQTLNSIDIPRSGGGGDDGSLAYPDLAHKVSEEWNRNEARHFAPDDPMSDRAVLHTANSTKFAEVVAVIDAIHAQKRRKKNAKGEVEQVSAFDVTFAAN